MGSEYRLPAAPTEPTTRVLHGDSTVDPYAWMINREDPRLRAFLAAERAHYDRHMERLRDLVGTLVNESLDRMPLASEDSVGRRCGDRTYRLRSPLGGENLQLLLSGAAVPGRDNSEDEVIIDLADLARETGFAELGTSEPSPDGRLLAWSVDTTGDEFYELRIRDLTTGEDLLERMPITSGAANTPEGHCPAVAWGSASDHLFYLVPDALGRACQVWRHRIGERVDADELVVEETEARFELTLRTSGSGELIIITAASRDTTEVRFIRAAAPTGPATVLAPRRTGVEYRVDHARDGTLYVVTDLGAPEFTLMRGSLSSLGRSTWQPVDCAAVAPARTDTRLLRCDVVDDRLVLTLRRGGAPLLAITDLGGAVLHEVRPLSPGAGVRVEYVEDSTVVVADESLVEPTTWHRVDLHSGSRVLLTRTQVRGHSPSQYRTVCETALARDGAAIPVTMVHHIDTTLDGSAPCLLYGYGAYEACTDPDFFMGIDHEFQHTMPSLLNRGVVFAVAHVRGGGECGRTWWQQGRLERKQTTFNDFIDVADWLAGIGGTQRVDSDRIVSRGLSAGGLLQGVVYSQRPDRWRAVVAEVPFVDCVNSMLDASIPLTVNEWDEWGDPREANSYAFLRAYSPYENPPACHRPLLLVTGSFHDPRVRIHEPAKWVAKLRATDTEQSTVLFRADLGAAGHTGPTGRTARIRYEAEVQALILDAMGIDH